MDTVKEINDHFVTNILFTFETLVDLDLGFIKYFKINFPTSKFVDTDIIKSNDSKFYKTLLFERDNINPLSIIIKPAYIDQIDSLYDEIYTKDTWKIILLSPSMIFRNVLLYILTLNFMKVTILCRNEIEEQYCKQVFNNVTVIQRKDLASLDDYDALYLKHVEDVGLVQKPKDVYLLSYYFNMENHIQGLPKLSAYGNAISSLRLHLALPYNDYIKPID